MEEDKQVIINNFFVIRDIQKEQFEKMLTLFKPIIVNHAIKTIKGKTKLGPKIENVYKEEAEEEINKKDNEKKIEEKKIEEKKIEEKKIEEKEDDFSARSSSDTKTDNFCIEIPENKENNIFKVQKEFFKVDSKKMIGRKRKDSSSKSVHTKFSHDNILRKIKVKFFHKIIKYINRVIIAKSKTKIKLLKPLKGEISQNNNIKFNRELLNLKLKEIFTKNEINGKFKKFDKHYNQDVIDKIYEEQIPELIELLEMSFLEVFNIFKSNDKEKFKEMEKLDTVVEEIKIKEKNESYSQKLEYTALNFEKNYLEKIPRK